MNYDCYVNDHRCGGVVTINDKNAYYEFKADLKSLEPIAGMIDSVFYKGTGGSDWVVNSHQIQPGKIEVTFYVYGASKQECYVNTSNLISECRDCIIKTDEDEFEYVAVLTSVNFKETGIDHYNEVVLIFDAIRRYDLVTYTMTGGTGLFVNVGNVESGVIFEIVPDEDMETAQVAGITIHGLTENLAFVIDGINGEVKVSGINRFLDTDLIDFPKVKPGVNTIEFSQGLTVKAKFYPTFLI